MAKKDNPAQYQKLLQHSKIAQYDAGEQVLRRSEQDGWSYFLVKGQLVVSLTDRQGKSIKISQVNPGKVFGDLSALLKTPRTARCHRR
ncbi:MAG: CRP/FNR family cyclic AMP-dependent transcriptional regulator [Cellvibrionaceae bacterium]